MISIKKYQTILSTLSEPRKNILINYYLSSPYYDTVEIAEALNYQNINSVNLQLGSLGVFFSRETGVVPKELYEYKGKERIAYFTLVHGVFEKGWQLVRNLEIAIENLGWVKDMEVDNTVVKLETEINTDVKQLYREGKVERVFVNRFERDKRLREACLKIHKNKCAACKIDFKKMYGDDIPDIIHVHHIKPLREVRKEKYKSPLKDLIPLCPNCHAVVHSQKEIMSIENLRKRLSVKH